MIDFIAGGATSEMVIAFQPSEAARARAWHLLELRKSGALTPDEASELEHYLQLEHILRLAKARARVNAEA